MLVCQLSGVIDCGMNTNIPQSIFMAVAEFRLWFRGEWT